MIDAVQDRFADEGLAEQLHTERLQPIIGTGGGDGSGAPSTCG
jgi:hypothetical protein